jgi:predicted RNase H-like HicB family nuclease
MKNQSLHTVIWKENSLFVAKFLELELASQGKTKSQAIKNLKEALDLYLEDEDKSRLELPHVKEVSMQIIPLS